MHKKLDIKQLTMIQDYLKCPLKDCKISDMNKICKKLDIQTYVIVNGKKKGLRKNELYEKLNSFVK
jgi:hypothetical protein